MQRKQENLNLKENLIYPDFNEYIDILSFTMGSKKYESRSEYEKEHTHLSIRLLERMLQKDNISDEQKKEYETTIRLLNQNN